jgi:hypothetical protein
MGASEDEEAAHLRAGLAELEGNERERERPTSRKEPKSLPEIGPIIAVAVVVLIAAALWVSIPRSNLSDNKTDSDYSPTKSEGINSFRVEIDTTISGGAFPVVHGRTNLPDGTVLTVSIMACDPAAGSDYSCPEHSRPPSDPEPWDGQGTWPGTARVDSAERDQRYERVTVKNGEFTSSRWLRMGKQELFKGTYALLVLIAGDEPPETDDILKNYGIALDGPLVKKGKPLDEDYDGNGILHKFSKPITPKSIQYIRFFDVGSESAEPNLISSPR